FRWESEAEAHHVHRVLRRQFWRRNTTLISTMPRSRRLAVADSLQLSENQIKTWFQNRRAKDKKIRSATTVSSSTVLLPSSSSPMLSPAPSAASSSSSSPPLSAPILQPSDPMPSLIELLALGKTDLLPLLNSQLLSSFHPTQPSPQ
ncbi:hypothetical protein PENTCL1PPCAC_4460, partial [Pristionchus entomophagus]